MSDRLIAEKLAKLSEGDTFVLIDDGYQVTARQYDPARLYACNLSDGGHDLRVEFSHVANHGEIEIEELTYGSAEEA